MPFVSYLSLVFSNGGFPARTAPDNHGRCSPAHAVIEGPPVFYNLDILEDRA